MILIVGMGLTGLTIADQIVKKTDNNVLLIEKTNRVGGIHYDYIEKNCIIQEYQPNIFCSDDINLWNYINSISKWDRIITSEYFCINKKYIPSVFSIEQINTMFNEFLSNDIEFKQFINVDDNNSDNCEDFLISKFGKDTYNHLYKKYIFKKFGINPLKLHRQVGERIFDIFSENNKKYIGIPSEGYTNYFNKILQHSRINYLLETDYKTFVNNNDMSEYSKIIYTGKLDDFFDKLNLDYIGYNNKKSLHVNYYQPHSIINYLSSNESTFRCIEHKYFQLDENKQTFITNQSICYNEMPFIPIESIINVKKVKDILKNHDTENSNIYFVGRLCEFKDLDTAEIIENALHFIESTELIKKIIDDRAYSYSLINILNKNSDFVINNKINKAKKMLKDAYLMKMNKINYQQILFDIKSRLKFSIESIYDHCIVVSRYNENVDWLNDLIQQNKWIKNIIIYNKGNDDIYIKYPNIISVKKINNIGREGETYLQHIINNYDSLNKHIWFIQADPFEHSPDFTNLLKIENIKEYNNNFQTLTYRYLKTIPSDIEKDNRFYINNNRIIEYFIDKHDQQVLDIHTFFDNAHQNKMDEISQRYDINNYNCYYDYICDYIGIPIPAFNIIGYTWSAIFYVNNSQIYLNKKECYEKLKFKLLEYDEQGGIEGYMLERFWNYLFTRRSYSNIHEIYNLYKFPNFENVCGCYHLEKNILFILNNQNNQCDIKLKTGIYDKFMTMLYIDSNSVIEIPTTRFNTHVLHREKCLNIEDAKHYLLRYSNEYQNKIYEM